ncbi:MAG: hypothetical protein ACM3JE_04335 [Betaproteobacteria bacterium]
MSITLRMIWRTQEDSKVCPVCKALEGYTWTLKAGEPYPKQLVHPQYGTVYDTRPAAQGSLIKEEHDHNCRCTLIHQFDVSNIFAHTHDNDGKTKTCQETVIQK